MVDLVADIVDICREVVLGMVVDYVTDVREDQVLKYAVLQVFQKPAKSHVFEAMGNKQVTHKALNGQCLTSDQETTHSIFPLPSYLLYLCSE